LNILNAEIFIELAAVTGHTSDLRKPIGGLRDLVIRIDFVCESNRLRHGQDDGD
jgi:hypothetical protein